MISMEIGVMSRKEIPDSSHIIVWFTPVIPVSAGPDLQGQLRNTTHYKAIEVSPKVDVAAIKEPQKGKKASAEEFAREGGASNGRDAT